MKAVGYIEPSATSALLSRAASIVARRASCDSAIDIGEVALACKPERHCNLANRLFARYQHLPGTQNSFPRYELMRRHSGGLLEASREMEWAHVHERREA